MDVKKYLFLSLIQILTSYAMRYKKEISAKGQVVIPKKLREKFGLRRISFESQWGER